MRLADGEIPARVEPRRRWTAQEKAALLAEVEAAGGKVKIVARRHRISESLLYNWRAARKAAPTAMRGSLTLWIEDAALGCWQTIGPSGQAGIGKRRATRHRGCRRRSRSE
jgi:Transposase